MIHSCGVSLDISIVIKATHMNRVCERPYGIWSRVVLSVLNPASELGSLLMAIHLPKPRVISVPKFEVPPFGMLAVRPKKKNRYILTSRAHSFS